MQEKVEKTIANRALWELVLPLLKSPIKETWYTDENLIEKHSHKIGGDIALSSFTKLASGNQQVFVIGKNQFRSIKSSNDFKNLDNRRGNYKIEVWTYDPQILSSDKYVDKLSLFLTLQEDQDERVIGSLNDLVKEIKW